jgi:hypothetical protein
MTVKQTQTEKSVCVVFGVRSFVFALLVEEENQGLLEAV